MTWKTVVKEFVPPIVMKALRPAPPSGGGYISAAKLSQQHRRPV